MTETHKQARQHRSRRMAAILAGGVIGMVGLSYAAAVFYQLMCREAVWAAPPRSPRRCRRKSSTAPHRAARYPAAPLRVLLHAKDLLKYLTRGY